MDVDSKAALQVCRRADVGADKQVAEEVLVDFAQERKYRLFFVVFWGGKLTHSPFFAGAFAAEASGER